MDWTSYHRTDDINGYLKYLESTYPNIVKVFDIGKSSEGRPLHVIRISSGTGSTTKPAIWIDGGNGYFLPIRFQSQGILLRFYRDSIEIPLSLFLLFLLFIIVC